MNKILMLAFVLTLTPVAYASAAKAPSTLEKVKAIEVPKQNKEVKAAYLLLEEAVATLKTSDDEKLVVAILQGYAKVGKKEESLVGLEAFAPYFKKNEKKVRELAKQHLSKEESEAVLFGLSNMAENIGLGNDPSVKN